MHAERRPVIEMPLADADELDRAIGRAMRGVPVPAGLRARLEAALGSPDADGGGRATAGSADDPQNPKGARNKPRVWTGWAAAAAALVAVALLPARAGRGIDGARVFHQLSQESMDRPEQPMTFHEARLWARELGLVPPPLALDPRRLVAAAREIVEDEEIAVYFYAGRDRAGATEAKVFAFRQTAWPLAFRDPATGTWRDGQELLDHPTFPAADRSAAAHVNLVSSPWREGSLVYVCAVQGDPRRLLHRPSQVAHADAALRRSVPFSLELRIQL